MAHNNTQGRGQVPAIFTPVVMLLLLLSGCASTATNTKLASEAHAALVEANRDFTLGGQPIHPALIHLFQGWESDDGPVVVAIDVREGQDSHEFAVPMQRNGAEILCELPDKDPVERFGYQRLGTLEDGTHVVRTVWNGGGSANFEHLLLLRFYVELYHRPEGDSDWRLVLHEVGDYALGDRDEGEIILEAHDVKIEPSAERTTEYILRPDETVP
jgi:hypothetical protein